MNAHELKQKQVRDSKTRKVHGDGDMKQLPLTPTHHMSARMAIAMHIAGLMPSRNRTEKRQAVAAWARVVREDLQDKMRQVKGHQ